MKKDAISKYVRRLDKGKCWLGLFMVLFQMILAYVPLAFSQVPVYALHDKWSQISNSYYMEVLKNQLNLPTISTSFGQSKQKISISVSLSLLVTLGGDDGNCSQHI